MSGRRRLLYAAVPVVVLAGCVAGGWYLGRRTAPVPATPATTTALALTVPLAAGAPVQAQDLRPVTIERSSASALAGLLTSAAERSVLGMSTRSLLPAGALVTRSDLAGTAALPGAGQDLVGLALKPGQVPAGGLAVGDHVQLLGIPSSQRGQVHPVVLVASAPVWSITGPGRSGATSGATSVVVLVGAPQAASVAAYAAGGAVAAVRLGG